MVLGREKAEDLMAILKTHFATGKTPESLADDIETEFHGTRHQDLIVNGRAIRRIYHDYGVEKVAVLRSSTPHKLLKSLHLRIPMHPAT